MSQISINEQFRVKEETHVYPFHFFSCSVENLEEYNCLKCNYSTHIKVHYVKHKHNTETPFEPSLSYTCQKCMNFRTYSNLFYMKHKYERCKIKKAKKCKIVTLYKCGKCQFESNRRFFVKNHTKSVHFSEDVYCICLQCGHKTQTANGMKLHMLCTHTPSEDIKWFQCDHCPYKTKLKHNLQKHKEMKHIQDHGFACDQCDYVSKTKWYFNIHQKAKHTTLDTAWLKCDQCLFKTKWPALLRRHLKINHPSSENAWLKCEHCPFETQSRDRWRAHRFQHSNSQWFQCEQCRFGAKYKHNLLRHVRAKHTDPSLVKWVQCEFCDYKSKYNYIIKKHVFTEHSEEKVEIEETWYPCDRCCFKTKRNYLLKEHVIAMHTASENIQWFQCEQCAFKAKLKGGLKRHVKTRHGRVEDVSKHEKNGKLISCDQS